MPLAEELLRTRRFVKEKIGIDERMLLPARQRYNGKLYCASGKTLDDLAHSGAHIVILSGSYGMVAATELIGWYDAAFKPSWWPDQRAHERAAAAGVRMGAPLLVEVLPE
jgi:cytoplasmic iron level regulating protein YaaA (DUF328/UPF0246 family)